MPADGRADPRLLWPIQGAALRDRAASFPALLVDPGPLREGPLLHHTDCDGRYDVHAAEDDPNGGGSDAGKDHAYHACSLYLLLPELPFRISPLLAC